MIKGMMKMKGRPVLFLGLSGENVARLAAGEPIYIRSEDVARLGLPAVPVVIHYGQTEQAILDEFTSNGMEIKTLLQAPETAHTGTNRLEEHARRPTKRDLRKHGTATL